MITQPKKPLTEKDKIFVFLNHDKMCVKEIAAKLRLVGSLSEICDFMERHDLDLKIVKKPKGRSKTKAGYFNVDDLKNMF